MSTIAFTVNYGEKAVKPIGHHTSLRNLFKYRVSVNALTSANDPALFVNDERELMTSPTRRER